MNTMIPPYRVQVEVRGEAGFHGNALTFETVGEARDYAIDLFHRWTSVDCWRVVDAEGSEVSRKES